MPDARFHDTTYKMLVTCPNCSHAHSIEVAESELTGNPSSERYYRLAELQKMLGVARRTLLRWIYDKKLHAVKLTEGPKHQGAPWFVPASSLEAFRTKHRR